MASRPASEAAGGTGLVVIGHWVAPGAVAVASIDIGHLAVLRSIPYGNSYGWELDDTATATGAVLHVARGPDSPSALAVTAHSVYLLVQAHAHPTPGTENALIRFDPTSWAMKCRTGTHGGDTLTATRGAVWLYDPYTLVRVEDGSCRQAPVTAIPPDEATSGLASDSSTVVAVSASYRVGNGKDTYEQHVRTLDAASGRVLRTVSFPTARTAWYSVAVADGVVFLAADGWGSAQRINVDSLHPLPDLSVVAGLPGGHALAVLPNGSCIVLTGTLTPPCPKQAHRGTFADAGADDDGNSWYLAQVSGQTELTIFHSPA